MEEYQTPLEIFGKDNVIYYQIGNKIIFQSGNVSIEHNKVIQNEIGYIEYNGENSYTTIKPTKNILLEYEIKHFTNLYGKVFTNEVIEHLANQCVDDFYKTKRNSIKLVISKLSRKLLDPFQRLKQLLSI